VESHYASRFSRCPKIFIVQGTFITAENLV